MATNDIPLTNPATRPAPGAGSGRPQAGSQGMDSDLAPGPTGSGNGLTAVFDANTGGTSLIDSWSQQTLPGGGIVAGSTSGMALFNRVDGRMARQPRDQQPDDPSTGSGR